MEKITLYFTINREKKTGANYDFHACLVYNIVK